MCDVYSIQSVEMGGDSGEVCIDTHELALSHASLQQTATKRRTHPMSPLWSRFKGFIQNHPIQVL